MTRPSTSIECVHLSSKIISVSAKQRQILDVCRNFASSSKYFETLEINDVMWTSDVQIWRRKRGINAPGNDDVSLSIPLRVSTMDQNVTAYITPITSCIQLYSISFWSTTSPIPELGNSDFRSLGLRRKNIMYSKSSPQRWHVISLVEEGRGSGCLFEINIIRCARKTFEKSYHLRISHNAN